MGQTGGALALLRPRSRAAGSCVKCERTVSNRRVGPGLRYHLGRMRDGPTKAGVSGSAARHRSPSALVAFTACAHRTELERAAEVGLVAKPHFPNAAVEGMNGGGQE